MTEDAFSVQETAIYLGRSENIIGKYIKVGELELVGKDRISFGSIEAFESRSDILKKISRCLREYGIDIREERQKQKGLCGVCKEPLPPIESPLFHVDHDHNKPKKESFRSLVHQYCNQAMAYPEKRGNSQFPLMSLAYLWRHDSADFTDDFYGLWEMQKTLLAGVNLDETDEDFDDYMLSKMKKFICDDHWQDLEATNSFFQRVEQVG